MCLTLRNTASRGRSGLPATLRRIRLCTRLRMMAFDSWAMLLSSRGSGFAGLLAQSFVRVTDSLVLVRIRGAQRAHVGRHLAQQLAIAARENQRREIARGFFDFHIDAVGQIKLDWVRVAQIEGGDAALDLALVADAEDLQLARKAAGHARHGV